MFDLLGLMHGGLSDAMLGQGKEQSKMTREEAIKTVRRIYNDPENSCMCLVKSFEALGLLKFDEPKKPKYIQIERCGGVDAKTCSVSVADMIDALRRINIICVEKEP